jgi:hypothetical protein
VLSGRGLCDELITRLEESYRLCCVVVCDLETSWMRRLWHALGRSATTKKKQKFVGKHYIIVSQCTVQNKHKDPNKFHSVLVIENMNFLKSYA